MLSFRNKNFDKLAFLLALVAVFVNFGSSVNATKTSEISVGNTKLLNAPQKKSEKSKTGFAFLVGLLTGPSLFGIVKLVDYLCFSHNPIISDVKRQQFIILFEWWKHFVLDQVNFSVVPLDYWTCKKIAIEIASDCVFQIVHCKTVEERKTFYRNLCVSCTSFLFCKCFNKSKCSNDIERSEIKERLNRLTGFTVKISFEGAKKICRYYGNDGEIIEDIHAKCQEILNNNIEKLFEGESGKKNVDLLTDFVMSLLTDPDIGKTMLECKYFKNDEDSKKNIERIVEKFTEAAGVSLLNKYRLLAIIKASIEDHGKRILMLDGAEYYTREELKGEAESSVNKIDPTATKLLHKIKSFKEKVITADRNAKDRLTLEEYEVFAKALLSIGRAYLFSCY
ncbi:MAG: hypothetical protein FWC41_07155 [Firmicutes bacterium]|nr:hypothetical protein [Bacillota bacterium]